MHVEWNLKNQGSRRAHLSAVAPTHTSYIYCVWDEQARSANDCNSKTTYNRENSRAPSEPLVKSERRQIHRQASSKKCPCVVLFTEKSHVLSWKQGSCVVFAFLSAQPRKREKKKACKWSTKLHAPSTSFTFPRAPDGNMPQKKNMPQKSRRRVATQNRYAFRMDREKGIVFTSHSYIERCAKYTKSTDGQHSSTCCACFLFDMHKSTQCFLRLMQGHVTECRFWALACPNGFCLECYV